MIKMHEAYKAKMAKIDEDLETKLAEIEKGFKLREAKMEEAFKLHEANCEYCWEQRADLHPTTRFALSKLINLQMTLSVRQGYAEHFASLTAEEILKEFFPPISPKENSSE